MPSEKIIVTTSWDDGDPADMKVAQLLQSREMGGTFYVPLTGYRGRATVVPGDLRALAAGRFEVGGHGVSHQTLPKLSPEGIAREVRDSKSALEDLIGSNVRMFCYPRGKYNHCVVENVRMAGYRGARTTRMLGTRLNFDDFEMPTSLQAYPHNDGTYARNILKSGDLGRLVNYATRFRRTDGWVQLGKQLFDYVLQNGGIWHLYGHSWELEGLSLWSGLSELLDYVSGRDGVLYLNNIETLQHSRG